MEQDLLNLIKKRKLFFGHVMIKGDCLEKETTQGTVPRTRKQPSMRKIDNMEKWAEMSFDKLLRGTGNRRRSNRLVHKVTNLGMRMLKNKTGQDNQMQQNRFTKSGAFTIH